MNYIIERSTAIRTHSGGIVSVDASGQAKTRPVLELIEQPTGRVVATYPLSRRAEAEADARRMTARAARIEREHLPGWVGCRCPQCTNAS